jgi:CelD/BcsL family acetyltransferase involved in cellulose biosynthesis
VPAPRVTCPRCGKQQALPLPGAGGRRWCNATYCDGKLDEALHGAAMRALVQQAEQLGIEEATALLRDQAKAIAIVAALTDESITFAVAPAGGVGAMLNKKVGE